MRYAMDRNTYMPIVVADYIKRHRQFLDDKFLVLATDDIRRQLEDYAECDPNSNLWRSLLDALKAEQEERATRQARKIRLCPVCGKPLEVMSITSNRHSPGGFDVIARCQNCHSNYEWYKGDQFTATFADGFPSFAARAAGNSTAGDILAKQFQGDGDLKAFGRWYANSGAEIGDTVRVTFTAPDVVLFELLK